MSSTVYSTGDVLATLLQNQKGIKITDDPLFSRTTIAPRKERTRKLIETKAEEEGSKKKKKPKLKEPKEEDADDEEVEKQISEDESPKRVKFSPEVQKELTEQDSRTAFVGNIPWKSIKDSSENDESSHTLKKLEKALKKEFSKYGEIDSIRLRSIGLKSVKVPTGSGYHLVRKVAANKDSLDDRIDTCNAFIVFKDVSSVIQAVEKGNGTIFLENHLRVDFLRENSKGKIYDRKRTVFIGNLTFESSEEDCWKHFNQVLGENSVLSVRIIRDPVTNLGKGFGYVLLKEENLVEEAIRKLNNTEIRSRPIRVTKCERPNKKKNDMMKRKNDKNFVGKMATDPSEKPLTRKARKLMNSTNTKKKQKKISQKKKVLQS